MYSTIVLNEQEKKIAKDIVNHAEKEGSYKSNWYVGIAADPEDRLFNDHNVSKDNGWWIYRDAGTNTSARRIESYLLDNYGFDGGAGGGDHTTKFVYAYLKTYKTNP